MQNGKKYCYYWKQKPIDLTFFVVLKKNHQQGNQQQYSAYEFYQSFTICLGLPFSSISHSFIIPSLSKSVMATARTLN